MLRIWTCKLLYNKGKWHKSLIVIQFCYSCGWQIFPCCFTASVIFHFLTLPVLLWSTPFFLQLLQLAGSSESHLLWWSQRGCQQCHTFLLKPGKDGERGVKMADLKRNCADGTHKLYIAVTAVLQHMQKPHPPSGTYSTAVTTAPRRWIEPRGSSPWH